MAAAAGSGPHYGMAGRSLVLIAAMTAAAASAGAEPAPGRHSISLGAGFVEPVSKVRLGGGAADNGDLGVQFLGQYAYALTPRLSAGVEAAYAARTGTLSTRLYPAADARVAGDTWLLLGLLHYSPWERGRARPFVELGAGGAWNKTTIDVKPSLWADTGTREVRRVVDDDAWTPAASVRLGVELAPAALDGFLRLEVGWTGLARASYGATPRGQALGLSGVRGALHMATFSARHGWRF